MRPFVVVGLLLFSSSCSFGLDTLPPPEGDDTADTAGDPCAGQSVCIASVTPNRGPVNGGTVVEVRGVGFGGDPELRFGNAPLTVTVLGENHVQVTAPPVAVEGSVDVTVVGPSGSATMYDGFTYGDGVVTDDTGGGDDTGSGPTGLVGGLVESDYIAIGCPECFGLTDQLSFEVVAAFHAPVNGSWFDWMPRQGSCVQNPTAGGPASVYDDVGEWAYLTSGARSVPLRRTPSQGAILYSSGPLTQNDRVDNAAYDLSVPDGGSLGPFEVPDVLVTASGFDDIQPIALLNPAGQAFAARVSAAGAVFTWAPTGIADSFVVDLSIYNAQGTSFLGEVFCVTTDSGAFQVPSTYLSSYPNNALVAVNLYRLNRQSGVNPADGSTIEGSASIGILGTATLVR